MGINFAKKKKKSLSHETLTILSAAALAMVLAPFSR